MSSGSQLLQKISKDYSEASLFHELAERPLFSLGLRLINEPHRRFSMFGGCSALYEYSHGLFLSVDMEPGDSNSLTLRFGRKWLFEEEFATFSNYFYAFANRVGFALPEYYRLGYGQEMLHTFRNVIRDMEESWQKVVDSISLPVLKEEENSKYGAAQIIRSRLDAKPEGKITVADFHVPGRS